MNFINKIILLYKNLLSITNLFKKINQRLKNRYFKNAESNFKIRLNDNRQQTDFWRMQHCYAMIPIVQLLDGHILITTKRKVQQISQLQPVEVFDLSLAIRFISKSLQSFYNLSSTTIHIQNSQKQSPIKHIMVHIIPRKSNDLKNNDEIYDKLASYPTQLSTHYNQKMNFYINAYANKILEGINQQAKKYQHHFNICWKQEKQN